MSDAAPALPLVAHGRRPTRRATVLAGVAALAALAASPAVATAQQRATDVGDSSSVAPPTDPRLVPGARVRVTYSALRDLRIQGGIDSVLPHAFVLDTTERRQVMFIAPGPELLPQYRVVRVPYDQIGRLEISRGRNKWKGAAVWGLVGAGIGGLVTGLSDSPERNPTARQGFQAAATGAIVGAIIGGTIGYATGREKWERLAWP